MNKYLLKTSNFHSNWLWVERTFAILTVLAMAYYLERYAPGPIGYKLVFVVVIISIILLMSATDVALDRQYLYHIKRSVFPALGKIEKYNVSEIKEISFTHEHSRRYDMLKVLFFPSWFDVRILLADKTIINLRMHKRDIAVLRANVKIQY